METEELELVHVKIETEKERLDRKLDEILKKIQQSNSTKQQ